MKRTRRIRSTGRSFLLAVAFSLAATASVPAAAQSIWIGGTDNNLSTAANWAAAVAPVSGPTAWLVYDNTALSFTPAIDIAFTTGRIDFVGGTPYSLSGAVTLNGAGPLIFATGATHTLASTVALGANATVNNASDLLSTGGFTGPVSLTKTGAGQLTVTGVLNNTGAVTVNGGTLRIGDGVTGPGAVSASAFITNAALEFDSPAGVFMGAGISGTGTLTVGGGGLVAAGPFLTHQGATTVNAGILAGTIVNNAPLTIAAGATVETGGSTVGSLAGAGTLNSNSAGTPVTVGGDNTSTTFSGTLGSIGPFEKVGSGTQTLSGAFSLSGTVTVNGGTLRIGDGVTGPGAVSASAFITNAALEFDSPAGVFMGAGISGTGTLTVGGGGLVAAGPFLTHQGATTVNAGILAGTIVNNAPLTIAAGATVETGGSTVGSLAGAGTLNSNSAGTPVTVGGDNSSTTFSGTLGSIGPFEKVGSGTQTLSGAFSLSGTVTVNGGTLRIGDGVTGPGAVSASAFITNAALEFDSPAGVFMGAGISGTGTLTVGGGGLVAAGPFLTHQGATTVNAGILAGTIVNNAPLTIAAGATVETGGSTVGSLAGAGTLNSNSAGTPVTMGGDNTSTTFSGTLGSIGPFEKVGSGTLTLSGASTNTGTKTVVGGSLLLNGSIPGPVEVNAGSTLGGTGTISGPVTINAGGTLAPGLSPGITNTGDLALAGALVVEIEGTTVGTQYDQTNVTGTVTIAGGTLTLAGAYAPFSGNTFVIVANDGADAVTGTFAGLPEGATIVFNGATLQISYVGGTGNDITLTALAPTSTTWNGAGANDNWGTGANWVGGASPASGNATVVTFPTASARFAPAVDAPWTVNRMDITGTTAYAMTGQAITFAGAAPQLNASGAAHSLANPLTLSAALAVNNATTLTLSGAIGGASGITKTGAGILSLSGTSTFAGGTTANGGTLFVNGTILGPVTVNAGATLGGTGTITGAVAINAGGTLAPGLSPGLTNTGDLNLAGAFLVEIEGTTVGTQYDQTNVTGTVTIAGGTLTLAGAYVPVAGNVFTIIANDGADAVTGTFAGLAEGATITLNGVNLVISYVGGTGNDVVLTAQAAAVAAPIPTLSAWAMILLSALLAAAGMATARRR